MKTLIQSALYYLRACSSHYCFSLCFSVQNSRPWVVLI